MNKSIRGASVAFLALPLCAASLLIGCGGSQGPPPPQPAARVIGNLSSNDVAQIDGAVRVEKAAELDAALKAKAVSDDRAKLLRGKLLRPQGLPIQAIELQTNGTVRVWFPPREDVGIARRQGYLLEKRTNGWVITSRLFE